MPVPDKHAMFFFGLGFALIQLALIIGGVPQWAWTAAYMCGLAFGINLGRGATEQETKPCR